MAYKDLNKRRLTDRKYYQKNKERIRECKRKNYQKNREKILKQKRDRYVPNHHKCNDCYKMVSLKAKRCSSCSMKKIRKGGNHITPEGIKRLSESKLGPKNPQYGKKRKRIINRQGYIFLYVPGHPNRTRQGYVAEHRLIFENKLGRYLNHMEVIHHINEKREDNRIENLMLFESNSKHLSFHRKIKQFGITNPILRQIENGKAM